MTSAFIIEIDSELQSDPSDETNALLRILIYKIDSTTFGDSIPTLPQWSGPPRAIVQVQMMLYASLAASIFSAFLSILSKQWLNQYASVDMRGSPIERSRDRQRKLDGIATWYFDLAMESLSMMLQFAVLLLGCALSVYLWGIDRAVASVILGVTTFGAIFYAFIVVAGAIFASCPYQTPGARILRRLLQKVPILPKFFTVKDPTARHSGTQPGPEQAFKLFREAIALYFRCISWILQISLDRRINQLTLEFLASILKFPGYKATIAADCFKLLRSCVRIADNQAAVMRGSEQLAATAATCLLVALSHSLRADPRSKILKDMHWQYNRIFPPTDDLRSLPFRHTIYGIHSLLNRRDRRNGPSWNGVDPSIPGNVLLSHDLASIAWFCYIGSGLESRKVPRWVLRFSLHALLWDSEPPVSVTADCLMIIAIDLGFDFGYDISESYLRNPDKRYICLAQLHMLSR